MIASTAPASSPRSAPGSNPDPSPDPGFDRLELFRFLLLVGSLGCTMHFVLRAAVHIARDLSQLAPMISRLLPNLA